MTNDILRTVSRRAVLTAGVFVGIGSLSASVKANPPKGVGPADPDTDVVVRKIGDMQRTIGKIQDRLELCDSNICATVFEHSSIRMSLASTAKQSAEAHEWTAATDALTEVKSIVEDDIDLLESVEDRGSIGDVLGLERALLNQTTTALGVMPGDNVS
jgi:hypothetical protein